MDEEIIKHVDDHSETYDENEELKPLSTNKIVSKELFVKSEDVLIKDIKKNQFGKPALEVKGESEETTGQITITNKDFNMLLEKFGSKKSDIVGKTVHVKAERFAGSANASPGWTLRLSVP